MKPVTLIKSGTAWTVYQDPTGALLIYPTSTSYEKAPPIAFRSIEDAKAKGWQVVGEKQMTFASDGEIGTREYYKDRCEDLGDKLKVAIALCEKFVNKVETGRARSRETYAEALAFLEEVKEC